MFKSQVVNSVVALLPLLITVVEGFGLYGNSFGVPGVNATFDYVVVGGGTAGLTIATRLAENGTNSVAVIEAGSFYQIGNGNGSVIPALAPVQYTGSSINDTTPLIDWNFNTTEQPGLGGRRIRYARGKTLGGSSARNYLAYHRGTTGSYQMWADEVGDQSYTFENLLPYFQRSVNFTAPNYPKRNTPNSTVQYDPSAFTNSTKSARPLHVSYPNGVAALSSWAYKAMAAVGLGSNTQGFSSGNLLGIGWVTSCINPENSHRSSSQTSFLDYAFENDNNMNLQTYVQTMAKRIIFDGKNTAKGVSVTTAGYDYTLTAAKELILSAGTFQSPQLLMVSGVGPRETLEKYNITVRVDLPGLGQNMWDHVFFGVNYRIDLPTASVLSNNPAAAAAADQQYRVNASGPLSGGGADVLGWERYSDNKNPSLASIRAGLSNSTIAALDSYFPADWPEFEYLPLNAWTGDNVNYRLAPVDGYNYATVAAALISPLSRGNTTISSNDMSDAPIINWNALTHPADKEMVVAAVKRLRQFWDNMSNITVGEEYYPGREAVPTSNDTAILEYVQRSAQTVWHASSTCKMGRANDTMAVVDTRARVYGTRNLRVVDAAAFPFLTPGHPQSGVYMLAEKIADDIKMSR